MPQARLYTDQRWRPHQGVRYEVGESMGYGRRAHQEDGLWWRADGQTAALVVFDGMGGHSTGEFATREGVAALNAIEPRTPRALHEALAEGHRRVVALQEDNREYNGMCMTVAGIILARGVAHVRWAGDARVYRWRDGRLDQLTTDHRLLDQLIAQGKLQTPAEIEAFAYRNVIINALGTRAPLGHIATRAAPVRPGDRYLCCTDGIHDCVAHDLIAALMADRSSTPQEIADALGRRAEQHERAENHAALVLDLRAGHEG